MKGNPLVSIICITYNHEAYIRDCMEGFLMQDTNFNYEIIVHDDCSTDKTLEILRDYRLRNSDKITLLEETENQYSKGNSIVAPLVRRAKGEYIAFCEGDDYWIDPLKLQKQVDFLEKNPGMTYCFTNRYILNEITGRKILQKHKNKTYTLGDFMSGFNPGIQSCLFLKSCIDGVDLDFYKGKVNGDRLYPIICTMKGMAKCLPITSAVYRVTGKGVSSQISSTKSAEYLFIHTTTDFYKLHKAFLFPSVWYYVKGISNYVLGYVLKWRSFNAQLCRKQIGHYDGKKLVPFLVMCECMKQFAARVMKRLQDKLSIVIEKCMRKFRFTKFSSLVLTIEHGIFDLTGSHISYYGRTPIVNLNNGVTTIADPFLFSKNDCLFLFYELQDSFNAKGVIMMCESTDGKEWRKPVKVLEEPFHLSFPFVFEDNGITYMIPETFMDKAIRLYKGNESMSNFVYEKTLMSGEKFVDSCIIKHEGIYYLFTSIQKTDNSYILKLFYAEDILSEWIEHPCSPICENKYKARNAGSIFCYKKQLYRPAQECRGFYGQNLHIYKIDKLTKTEYSESPFILDFIPKGFYHAIGGHQFNTFHFKSKDYIAIDILQRSFNLYGLYKRFISKVK